MRSIIRLRLQEKQLVMKTIAVIEHALGRTPSSAPTSTTSTQSNNPATTNAAKKKKRKNRKKKNKNPQQQPSAKNDNKTEAEKDKWSKFFKISWSDLIYLFI